MSQVDKLGARFLDKQMEDLKMEALEAAKLRKKKKTKSREAVLAEAASATLEIDTLDEAISLEEQRRRDNLKLLCTIGFWNSLQVKRGNFFKQVEAILPKFWNSLRGSVPEQKSAMVKKLKPFLDKVKKLSELQTAGKVICMIDKTLDLTNMDKWGRLEMYINVSKCDRIMIREKEEIALGNIFDSCGMTISKNFTYDVVNKYMSEHNGIDGIDGNDSEVDDLVLE